MTKNKMLEATNGIVAILEPLSEDERKRVIRAARTVLGDEVGDDDEDNAGASGASTPAKKSVGSNAQGYFDDKAPQNKGEELAVAARYREEHQDATTTTKEQFREVVKQARRNFDDKNFKRDLNNAKVKGLFNRGGGKEGTTLSYYGQKYVDALPDREQLKALGKPKGAKRKGAGKRAKKAS